MTHALSKTWTEYYKDCEQQSDEELAGRMENFAQDEANARIARFVYEKRHMKAQYEFNLKLINRQLRWMKFSAILNAIVILLAVLLGWYLKEWKSQPVPKTQVQSDIQYKTESLPTKSQVLHPGRKSDKETLKPPSTR